MWGGCSCPILVQSETNHAKGWWNQTVGLHFVEIIVPFPRQHGVKGFLIHWIRYGCFFSMPANWQGVWNIDSTDKSPKKGPPKDWYLGCLVTSDGFFGQSSLAKKKKNKWLLGWFPPSQQLPLPAFRNFTRKLGQLSNERRAPGYLLYIGDYTSRLYGDQNDHTKPK